ncbi:MAG: MFS transporter [Chloroflexi bacterium]|nr:MFS transporter [Chloroflexota bacterium]
MGVGLPRRPRLGSLEPWQRNQLAIVSAVAVAFCAFELSNPFIPLYIRQLGVEDVNEAAFWAGMVSGITPLLAALMGPIWGSVADKYGRKSMVLRALICIGLMQTATAFVPNVYWLLAARVVMGMFAGFTSMSMALAIAISPRERMPQTISLVQAAQIAPTAIGPLIGGPISDWLGLRAAFIVTGIMLLLPISLIALTLNEQPVAAPSAARSASKGDPKDGSLFRLLLLPGFPVAVAILFLTRFSERAVQPTIPLYLIQLDTPAAQLATIAGVTVAGGAIAATCSSILYGRWARPETTRRLLLIVLSGACVVAAAFVLARGWPEVLGLRIVLGLLAGGTVSLAYTMGARLAPPDRSATTMALLASCGMLGTATAPLISGVIASQIGLWSVFIQTATAYLLAVVLLALPALRETMATRRSRTAEAKSS